MIPAVFLDRDGVLNESLMQNGVPHPPQHEGECRILPGVREACAALKEAGYLLVAVTNQPDVARGAQSVEGVQAINCVLMRELPLAAILACYHDIADKCDCRKPLPGLVLRAAKQWDVDLGRSFMVGDRWSDVEAGRAAGCKTIYVDCSYGEMARCMPDYIAADLLEASRIILLPEYATLRRPLID